MRDFVWFKAKSLYSDSLYRNSFWLMASNFVMAGIGFFYWIIAARLYSTEQIGIATTLISLASLITGLSLVGLNTSIVRFLPNETTKNDMVNTTFGIIILSSILVTVLAFIGLPWISPKLTYLQSRPIFGLMFIIFMIVSGFNAITDSMFIANRKTELMFVINTIMSLVKLVATFLLVGLGAYGIFIGFVSAVNVAAILSIVFLSIFFGYRFFPKIYIAQVNKIWRFSVGSYSAGILGMLNSTITPILITNSLGPTITAYYYMPSMITGLLQTVSKSISSAMTAEGSHDESSANKLFFRSLFASYLIVSPLVAFLMIFGPMLLSFFGKTYSSEGITFLRLTLVSLLIALPNTFLGPILTIRKKIKLILFTSTLGAIVGISLTLIFLPQGLYGLGLASIIGQTIMLVVYSFVVYFKI